MVPNSTNYLTFFSELRIGSWNINSIWKNLNSFRYNKLHYPEFQNLIKKKLLFCLLETHHTADESDNLFIEGYKCFSLCRPKPKNRKRYKPSGGLAAYVHNSILCGVERISIPGSESIILKLKKDFFGLINDVYLCFAYCVPANSSILSCDFMPEDIFEDLTNKLSQCHPHGDIILMGDLNARSKTIPDFIFNENNDHIPVPPPDLYEVDTVETSLRNNCDQISNSYGSKLIDLCKTVPLRILNGRLLGDLLGNFTCFTSRGCSAVDIGAVSPSLFKDVRYFLVDTPHLHMSDHTPIELGLTVHMRPVPSASNDSNCSLLPKPDKIVWDKNLAAKYKTLLESLDCKQTLSGFLETGILPNQTSIDSAASFLSNIVVETAKLAGMNMKKGAIPRRSARVHKNTFVRKQPIWHDLDCQTLLNELKKTSKLVSSYPRDPWIRGKLIKDTKQYNKLVKYKQKMHIDELFSQLETLHKSDPKKYMDLVKSLKNGSFDKIKNSDTDSVQPDEWFSHFSNLLGKSLDKSQADEDMEKYVAEHLDIVESDLDFPFTKKELLCSVKNLKNNKATSFDGIANEMLKYGVEPLSNCLLLMFNTILSFNLYTAEWKKDILGPLHKSGEKSDTNNF